MSRLSLSVQPGAHRALEKAATPAEVKSVETLAAAAKRYAESLEDRTCGWARVEGVWTCVQDHYAIGLRPDTSCGATLPQFP